MLALSFWSCLYSTITDSYLSGSTSSSKLLSRFPCSQCLIPTIEIWWVHATPWQRQPLLALVPYVTGIFKEYNSAHRLFAQKHKVCVCRCQSKLHFCLVTAFLALLIFQIQTQTNGFRDAIFTQISLTSLLTPPEALYSFSCKTTKFCVDKTNRLFVQWLWRDRRRL